MSKQKNPTTDGRIMVSFRITPDAHDKLKAFARQDLRSMTSQLEFMIQREADDRQSSAA